MTRLSIEIPDDLRAKLEARASQTGHASVEHYIEWLVRADADPIDLGAPEHLKLRSRERLESMLREAMQSPVREMGAADWDQMRRRLIEEHQRAKAG